MTVLNQLTSQKPYSHMFPLLSWPDSPPHGIPEPATTTYLPAFLRCAVFLKSVGLPKQVAPHMHTQSWQN